MNREIKFRGRTIQDGKWVYGCLLIDCDKTYQIWKKDSDGSFHNYLVHPESVGQFTGLYDKNSKEVYEGDILGYTTKNLNKKDVLHTVKVMFDNGAFKADVSKNLDGKLLTNLFDYLPEYSVHTH